MGGMVSGLGLLSGEKKLMKVGGILSLASSVVNGVQGLTGAATETAKGAAAGETASTLLGGGVDETAASLLTSPGAASNFPTLADAYAPSAGVSPVTGMVDAAANSGGIAQQLTQAAQPATGFGTLPAGSASALTSAAQPAQQSLLEKFASTIGQSDLAAANKAAAMETPSIWNSIKGGIDATGKWIDKNPMAASFGLQAVQGLAGAYEQDKAQDYQRSLYERARANLNSPVRLTFTPGG